MNTIFIAILAILTVVYVFNAIRDRILLNKVTNIHRGTRSERKLVLKLLKMKVPPVTIFHDLYLRKASGGYSQIDVAVSTKVGIIVFEVKDYSGWIFGNGYHKQWTQILAYGDEKHRFYNPIKQNETHIAELRKKCQQFQNIPFHSVIVFYGNSEFRDVNNVPEGVWVIKPSWIKKAFDRILLNNDPARYTDKQEVVKVLKEAVQNGANQEIRQEHANNVRNWIDKQNWHY